MAAGGGNEPNLTPFIDLFSVLICFLLMSAAWIQLEVMPSHIEKSTSADTPAETPPPPEEKKVQLSVNMSGTSVIFKEDEKGVELVYQESTVDVEGSKKILSDWKTRFPEKNDVILNTDANVRYGQMIKMYDVLIANEFPDVGINPR